MKYIIDTHVLIWFLEGNTIIPERIRLIIQNPDNEIIISIATIWEMAIKISLGKLILPKTFKDIIKDIKYLNISILEINIEHIKILLELPFIHKDPFDRMIISQSINEDIIVISKDSFFQKYSINVIWD